MTTPLPSGPAAPGPAALPPQRSLLAAGLSGGVRRWWPLGAAVIGGGVLVDGVSHLAQLPGTLGGAGLLGLGALWWLGRRRPSPSLPDAHDVAGWLRRLESLQGQFEALENEPPGGPADQSPQESAREQRRAGELASQRRLLERPGLTLGLAATRPLPAACRPAVAEALRGATALTLHWGQPLARWSDTWEWPQTFQTSEALIYWLQTPLSAADLRWLEALPEGLPAWLLVEHDDAEDATQLRRELTAQLVLRPRHTLLLWHPASTSLETVLAPVGAQLGRESEALRRQRQLRGLRGLHGRWQAELEGLRRQRFQALQQRTQWLVAAGVVAAPLPSLDLVVLAVANGLMLQEMARLWQVPWSAEQLRAAATELAKASLALGVVEWSSQMLLSLIRLHGATWLVGSAVQAVSAAYLTRVVGRAMADVLALSAGVPEPDLERIRREAPLLVARAAEAEKLDWTAFLQQARSWWASQRPAAC